MADNEAANATRRLLEVMARLLGPNGCPWDRQQTHQSLVPYLLEESYELAQAIEELQPGADPAHRTRAHSAMQEELGDVLLQVIFHARLAEQEGTFDFAAIANGLADKLIERHPHVFARDHLSTATEVSDAWERRKMATRESRLDGIPSTMPALMLASKVSSRAAKAGF
jgi:MazG family protein